MGIYNVTLQTFDFKGDSFRETWNDSETFLVEGDATSIGEWCHAQNVLLIKAKISDLQDSLEADRKTLQEYTTQKENILKLDPLVIKSLGLNQNIKSIDNSIKVYKNGITSFESKIRILQTKEMSEIHSLGRVKYRWIYKSAKPITLEELIAKIYN